MHLKLLSANWSPPQCVKQYVKPYNFFLITADTAAAATDEPASAVVPPDEASQDAGGTADAPAPVNGKGGGPAVNRNNSMDTKLADFLAVSLTCRDWHCF